MSIKKNMDIKISDGSAKLSEKFYVYQNDRGIELVLKINLSKMSFRSTRKTICVSDGGMFVGATIRKPNGTILGRDKVEMVDDTIRFLIDEDLTNDIDELGVYKIQFHLYDGQDNRITIPPVEFEVKELIGIEGEFKPVIGRVGEGQVNHCVVGDDKKTLELVVNKRYIKTEWMSGDVITAQRLNKIENAIEDVDNKISGVLIDDGLNIEKVLYSNESQPSIKTVKDALDKLLYFDLTISLSSNHATTVEKGANVRNVVFTWNYNKNVVSQRFNGISLENNLRTYTYTDSFTSNKTFTLNANDGMKDFSRSISFNFMNGRYWGVSDGTPNELGIQ